MIPATVSVSTNNSGNQAVITVKDNDMAFLIMQSIKSFSNFLLQQQQVSKGVENYHRPMIVNAHDGDGKQSGGRAVRLGGR